MKLLVYLSAYFLLISYISITADEIHKIPFGSKGNEIELEIFNESEIDIEKFSIKIMRKPEFIFFDSHEKIINSISAGDSENINFSFYVDANTETSLLDSIIIMISGINYSSTKKIMITILPPTEIDLLQNYPNPFNPSTVISYQIPSSSRLKDTYLDVHLEIFDILGRSVAIMVNKKQKPGYYEIIFNPSRKGLNISSGIYIYQLSVKNSQSESNFLQKKMVFLK